MSVNPDQLRQPGRTFSNTGTLVESAAHAAKPSTFTLGRIAAGISVAQLGMRLIPLGGRLLRRYPVGSLLVVAGLFGALYLSSEPQVRSRERPMRSG
jgi:hypothetical protein